jgi:hypothetical protein
MTALGTVEEAKKLRNEMDQSRMTQGNRVRQVLEEHEKLRIAVITGNITPELKGNYGDLLKSVEGLGMSDKLGKLGEWKRSTLDWIKSMGNDERNVMSARIEEAKKPAVIDYITNSITTKYMLEYPQSNKADIQGAIREEVTKTWDAAYGEVYGPKPLAMK